MENEKQNITDEQKAKEIMESYFPTPYYGKSIPDRCTEAMLEFNSINLNRINELENENKKLKEKLQIDITASKLFDSHKLASEIIEESFSEIKPFLITISNYLRGEHNHETDDIQKKEDAALLNKCEELIFKLKTNTESQLKTIRDNHLADKLKLDKLESISTVLRNALNEINFEAKKDNNNLWFYRISEEALLYYNEKGGNNAK